MHTLLQLGRHLLGTTDVDPDGDPEVTQREGTAGDGAGPERAGVGSYHDLAATCHGSCHDLAATTGFDDSALTLSGDDSLRFLLPGRQVASWCDYVSAFAPSSGQGCGVQIACVRLQAVSVQVCRPTTAMPGAAASGGLPRRICRRWPRRTSGAAPRGGLPRRSRSWEVHHKGDGGMRCRIRSWEVHHQGDGVPRSGAPWPLHRWEVHHQGDGHRPRCIYSWEVHHQGDSCPRLGASWALHR